MSLSPFYSFQSRFVTYLLNRPRICSRHDIVAALLASELRIIVMPLSKTFTGM